MMSLNLSGIAILNINGPDYFCILSLISKNEAINLFKHANFTVRNWTLKVKISDFFWNYI